MADKPEGLVAQDTVKYKRFNIYHRVEHWVFMFSFSILAVTGLVQKFAAAPISQWIVTVLGGIERTRLIHHTAATIMMLVVVYHIGAIGYRVYVQRKEMTMLPGVFDLKALWQAILYYIGVSKNPPQQGRYTFEEKAEYWAVVWGTVVMAVTGFMMWNPIATTKFLPGEFVPAAKIAHGLEAILAVVAIFLWHFYHVLVKTFNRSMFTGSLNREQMEDEHPLELADIKAGLGQPRVTPEEKRKHQRRFWPVYIILAAVMLVGIYLFITFEQTAIAYVSPAEQVEVFVPLTPTPLPTPIPTRTPLPGGLTSWEGGIGELLNQRCGICHNPNALIGGLDLTSYEAAVQGGDSGAAVIPGDPESSMLVIVQSQGGHPEQLSEEQLEQIYNWIEVGAPQ